MPSSSHLLCCRKIWPDIVDSDDSDVENEIDVDKLPPLEVGPNENRLQHTYCLWFSRKGTQRAATDYSKSLHVVGRCASVQQWWSLYSHLIRPTALKPYRELSLFKQGIKPMWEDPANSKGGQWVIRLRKNKIERAWENVCMAMLGEQFLVGDEICGIVLQTKYPVSQNISYISFSLLRSIAEPVMPERVSRCHEIQMQRIWRASKCCKMLCIYLSIYQDIDMRLLLYLPVHCFYFHCVNHLVGYQLS